MELRRLNCNAICRIDTENEKMPNPTLVIIHGMGTHTKESFVPEVSEPLNKAYKILTGKEDFDQKVDIEFIGYNDIFEKVRKKIADASFEDVNFPGNLAEVANFVNGIGNDFAEDSFFYTHFMDVILYRTYVTHAVQVSVAKQLLEIMHRKDTFNMHILCHSQGTAVMHDVLSKLYLNDIDEVRGENLLSGGSNRLNSISMIANVSQIIGMSDHAHSSVVRPGYICEHMINTRHVLDPFASIVRFKPLWERDVSFNYSNPVINEVERFNVHDVDHYLAHPDVHIPILRRLFFGLVTTNESLQNAYAKHRATASQGKFEDLKAKLADSEMTVRWNSQTNEFELSGGFNEVKDAYVEFRSHLKDISSQPNDGGTGNE